MKRFVCEKINGKLSWFFPWEEEEEEVGRMDGMGMRCPRFFCLANPRPPRSSSR